jgi:hypothetical protein
MYKYLLLFLFFHISLSDIKSQSTLLSPGGIVMNNKTDLKTLTVPKLSYADILKITTKQAGDIVFDTDSNCIRIYNGREWNCLTETSKNDFLLPKNLKSTFLGYGNNTPYNRGSINVKCMAFDDSDNIYLGGTVKGPYSISNNLIYGDYTYYGQRIQPLSSGSGFIMKITKMGEVKWVKILKRTKIDQYTYAENDFKSDISDLAFVNNGLYVTGSFNYSITYNDVNYDASLGNSFFSKLDVNTGAISWLRNTSLTGERKIYSTNSNIFIGGTFSVEKLILNDNFSLINKGGSDIYICKYDFDGNIVGATSIGSASNETLVGFKKGILLGSGGDFSGGNNNYTSNGTGVFIATINDKLEIKGSKRINGNLAPTDLFVGDLDIFIAGVYSGNILFGPKKNLEGKGSFLCSYRKINLELPTETLEPDNLFSSETGFTQIVNSNTSGLFTLGTFSNFQRAMDFPLKSIGTTGLLLMNFVKYDPNNFFSTLTLNGYTTTSSTTGNLNLHVVGINADKVYLFGTSSSIDIAGTQSFILLTY